MKLIANPHPECRTAGGCKDQLRLATELDDKDRRLLADIVGNYIEA